MPKPVILFLTANPEGTTRVASEARACGINVTNTAGNNIDQTAIGEVQGGDGATISISRVGQKWSLT